MQVYLIQDSMSAEGERNAVEFDAGKRAHYRPPCRESVAPPAVNSRRAALTCDKDRRANILLSSLGFSGADYREPA
jgi:hypothetical protein